MVKEGQSNKSGGMEVVINLSLAIQGQIVHKQTLRILLGKYIMD